MKISCSLVSRGEGQQGGILVKSAEESKAHRSSGSANAIVVTGINGRRRRRILAPKSVGDDYCGVTGKVLKDELALER